MRRIGIFANHTSASALGAAESTIQAAEEVGFLCAVDEALKLLPAFSSFPGFEQSAPEAIIALGGDGTILRGAARAVALDIPVLGVNFGRVGFMSGLSEEEAVPDALAKLREDNYFLDSRMLLSCSINGGAAHTCINDALLYKLRFSGVTNICVNIDGLDAGSVFCDGLIVSTPNGATGYSISAGGPVIAPGLDAAIVTPICPHTLSFRPIVAPAEAEICLRMCSSGYLAIDGIHIQDINPEDSIVITKSHRCVRFIRFGQRNLYSLIRTKLS